MRVAVCDDNEVFRKDIKNKLERLLPADTTIDLYVSGVELLKSGDIPDYLFLDIEMPGIDGIEVKDVLTGMNRRTYIVYMTSHFERMAEAFGERVLGFLIKPVELSKLQDIVDKLLKKEDRKYIEFDILNKRVLIPIKDILFIESDDKYSYINTRDSLRYCVRKTMREWGECLPDELFCRVNRSYIVNYEMCETNLQKIHLPGDKIVEVSRTNRDKVKNGYTKYLFLKASGGI